MQSEEVSKRRTPAGNRPCVEACITALSGGLFHICNISHLPSSGVSAEGVTIPSYLGRGQFVVLHIDIVPTSEFR